MNRAGAWLGQAMLYGAFAAFIGIYSSWPAYEHLAPDLALIKLSLVHHGKRLEECRAVAREALEKLPPNMRAPMECERERSPVTVEVDVDGVPALREVAEPTGLSRDGPAAVYRRLEIPAGTHRLSVRMDDSARRQGFEFERDETITLRPAQNLVIDFDAGRGGITLQ